MYKKTSSPEEKVKLLSSLYRFRNPKLLERSLDFSLTKNVRTQNLRTVFGSITSNPSSEKIIFQWVRKNWSKLSKYQNTHFVFMGLLESIILPHTGEKNKKKLRAFIKSKKIKYKKTQANAFERLDINTRWVKNNKSSLENYYINLKSTS